MKIQKKNKKMVVLFITLVFLVVISGCSNKDNESVTKVNVAILVGGHANAKQIDFNNELLKSTITQSIKTYSQIFVVNCDGNPTLFNAYNYEIPSEKKSASEKKLDTDASKKTDMLLKELSIIRADSPEVDDLESLELCVRALKSAPQANESKNVILFLDTGLQTSGLLNFSTTDLLNTSPAEIASQLEAKKAIPDLTDTEIYFCQGDVAYPQPELSKAQRDAINDIWRAIIEAGHGTFIPQSSLPGNDCIDNLPKVSVVNIQKEEAVFNPTGITIFDESKIQFEGNTTVYAHPESIKATMKPVADYLNGDPNYTLLVVGTTATGEEKFCQDLSNNRAEQVKATMIMDLNVSPSQILTKGLSFHDKWHYPDIDENALLIEEVAMKNRKVLLMDSTSVEAQEILQHTQ